MILYYITRTYLPSSAAQSIQIQSMAKAFSDIVKVILITRSTSIGSASHAQYEWIKINANNSLMFYIKILPLVLNAENNLIYTRDIFVSILSLLFRKNCIYEAHDLPRSLSGQLCTLILAYSKRQKLVCISKALKSSYINRYNFKPELVLAAHDGCFTGQQGTADLTLNLRKEYSIPENKKIILHTGSLYKGGGELFKYFIEPYPDLLHFVHIGGSPEEIDLLNLDLKALKLDNYTLLPSKKHSLVITYQKQADLLCYITTYKNPMYWCTSPLKIFEYMNSGKPIIASVIGSIAEILDNTCCYTYDPANPPTIEKSLSQYISSNQLALQKAARAKERALRCYDWVIRARLILDFTKKSK